MQTLYEKLGGETTVEAAVAIMHDKILSDPDIAHLYLKTDLTKLKAKHQKLLTYVFGGSENPPEEQQPNSLTATLEGLNFNEEIIARARSMASGHATPEFPTTHHEKLLTHLKHSMRELHIPDPLIDEALARAKTLIPKT